MTQEQHSALSENILFTLDELKLDARMMRGQGYDGTGNMAGKNKRTAALIQEQYPLAVYTHCASHALNFVYYGSNEYCFCT